MGALPFSAAKYVFNRRPRYYKVWAPSKLMSLYVEITYSQIWSFSFLYLQPIIYHLPSTMPIKELVTKDDAVPSMLHTSQTDTVLILAKDDYIIIFVYKIVHRSLIVTGFSCLNIIS